MKKQLETKSALFSVSIALIVSGTGEAEWNVAPVAWTGMVNANPPTLYISISKKHYSAELIAKSREFTYNIPSAAQFREVDYCGLVSGRDRNKFKDTAFTALKGIQIKTPIIKECPYNLECKVIKAVDLDDHTMFFGRIVEAHIDEDKVNEENPAKVDIGKVKPLIYCMTVREYRNLGGKLGDSFNVGKELAGQE